MKKTLLIIDDEKLVCEKLQTLLPWETYGLNNVISLSYSANAPEVIDKHKPDVIITDICMPGMNGLEIVEYVRSKKTNPYILLISAYHEFKYAQRAIDLGVQGYLLKPVGQEILKRRMDQYLELGPSDILIKPLGASDKKTQLKKTIDEYLQAGIHKKITLSQAAQAFYFSPTYFSQLFTQLYGESFTNYIQILKIKQARKYLINSSYKITHIADILGFNDYRYFGRVFKEHFGISPLNYRKNHTQSIES